MRDNVHAALYKWMNDLKSLGILPILNDLYCPQNCSQNPKIYSE